MTMHPDLPAPLSPVDCDLRDFAFMPLEVARLRDSDIASIEDAEAFRGAVLAWCAAWHQVPAASLPDDDRQLAKLLGYGRDIALWQRTREAGALNGFVRCSDGRLYHSVVAAKASQAWHKKLQQRANGRRGNDKRWGGVAAPVAAGAPDDHDRIATRSPPDRDATAMRSPSSGYPIANPSVCDADPIGLCSLHDRKGEGEGESNRSLRSLVGERDDEPSTRTNDPAKLLEPVRLWNEMAGRAGLSKVQTMSPDRRRKLASALKEVGGIEGWKIALRNVEESSFLTGRVKDFAAHFDFVLQKGQIAKVMEGAYRDRQTTPVPLAQKPVSTASGHILSPEELFQVAT